MESKVNVNYKNMIEKFIRDHVCKSQVFYKGKMGYSILLYDVIEEHPSKKHINVLLSNFILLNKISNYGEYWTDDFNLIQSFILENADLIIGLIPIHAVIGFFKKLIDEKVPWTMSNFILKNEDRRGK